MCSLFPLSSIESMRVNATPRDDATRRDATRSPATAEIERERERRREKEKRKRERRETKDQKKKRNRRKKEKKSGGRRTIEAGARDSHGPGQTITADYRLHVEQRRPLTFDDRSRKRFARVPHTNRRYLFILTSWPIRSRVMELLARTPDRTLIAIPRVLSWRESTSTRRIDRGVRLLIGLFGLVFYSLLPPFVHSAGGAYMDGCSYFTSIETRAPMDSHGVRTSCRCSTSFSGPHCGQTRGLTAVSASTRRVRARLQRSC